MGTWAGAGLMSDKFNIYINRILSAEGDYTDNEKDPGNWTSGKIGVGELRGTKFGISAASYPNLDIKNLTRDQAIDIYRQNFWESCHADDLPDAVAYSALDGAVNSGCVRSIMWVQSAAGVADDGRWGPHTASAVAASDPNDLLLKYNAYRLKFMVKLKAWDTFSAGWANRIANNLLYGAEDN